MGGPLFAALVVGPINVKGCWSVGSQYGHGALVVLHYAQLPLFEGVPGCFEPQTFLFCTERYAAVGLLYRRICSSTKGGRALQWILVWRHAAAYEALT